MVFLHGGPSHLDTYDMKPDAPVEFRGEFRPIHTNVPGIDICELMPRQAQIMDKLAILRGLHFVEEHSAHSLLDRLSRSGSTGRRSARWSAICKGKQDGVAALREPDESAAVGRSGLLRHGPSAVRAHRTGPGKPGAGVRRVARSAGRSQAAVGRTWTRFAATSTIAARWPDSTPTPCGRSTWSLRPRPARPSTSTRDARSSRDVRQGERRFPAGPAAGRGRHLGRHAGRGRLGHAQQQLQCHARALLPKLDQGVHALVSDLHERGLQSRRGGRGVGRIRTHAARQHGRRPRPLAAGRLHRAGRRRFQDRATHRRNRRPRRNAPRDCR